ncbi:hypothetical protein [Ulvibacterium sp.]|uniref:hypothetical protein n=1 Tax=Ulvibacterium sp. TaxID=2665914 RepID=UPI00260E0C06|nr:hypothetical protein [Ulvibacterium sp.]
MKYTLYLSKLIKMRGIPNLTLEQYQRTMNVVSLENRIMGIIKARKKIEGAKHSGQLDYLIYLEGRKLADLTDNMPEKDFWERLLNSEA